jgi:hypothetical protein
MSAEELRELVRRLALRIERLGTSFDALEKTMADIRTESRAGLEGLESRVNTKAGNWVVSPPLRPLALRALGHPAGSPRLGDALARRAFYSCLQDDSHP